MASVWSVKRPRRASILLRAYDSDALEGGQGTTHVRNIRLDGIIAYLILIIVLIFFGAGQVAQLGEGIGQAIKGFKKAVHDAEEEAVQPYRRTAYDRVGDHSEEKSSSGQQSLPPHVKNMIGGGGEGQNLTGQE